MLNRVLKHPFFWLLIVVLVAYWPLTFQVRTVPHDMVNCWVPWRFFISDTIQNGQFPWWNPYQQLGYPIHSDIQGPTWHLESLLGSMITTQGIQYIQYVMLIYLYVGGIGMYKLASLFTERKGLLLLGAIAYIGSGFFTNHTSHFFAIISGAFVPFILYFFIRLFQTNHWKYALWVGIFSFFNLTGGNQTFAIILFYLLIVILIYYTWKAFIAKDGHWKKIVQNCLLLGASVLSMGAVILGAFIQVKPYLDRLDGLRYKDASLFPFVPISSMTFINPMSTINEGEWLESDVTMNNAYFGIAMFIFLILFITVKKTPLQRIFLGFAIFTLLASFGSYFIVHPFTYDYLPLLNRFRFPSYYTYFFILCSIPLAVRTMDYYFYEEKINWKRVSLVLYPLIGFVLITTIVGGILKEDPAFFETEGSIYEQLRKTNLYQNWFYYGLVQIPLIVLLFYAIWKKKVYFFTAVVIINTIISVHPT